MPNDTDYPRFFDVLCAAVVTIWIIISAGLSLFVLFQNGGMLIEAIATPFFVLFAISIPTFIFGGLISFPFWWVGKRFHRLNRTLAGGVGAFTGFILAFLANNYVPADYSGTPIGVTSESLLNLLLVTCLGAIAGWNGYRVAWNGRRRGKMLKSKSEP